MNFTRKGKKARLPHAVREQINTRLHNGEEGKKLVVWLNALPEVQAVVNAEFGGKPIRAQNLSEWKQGGYRDWLAQQEAIAVAGRLKSETAELTKEGETSLTETIALWLSARFAVETRRIAETKGPERWRLLRELCSHIVELRRGDHSAQRLQIERIQAATAARHAEMRWKRKIIVGLETLHRYTQEHPEAKTAMDELIRLVRHPFDPAEQESL